MNKNYDVDSWLMGTSDALPQDLKLAVKDLMTKLQFSQGSLMVNQLKRSLKLIQTISMLEEELTSPQYLLTLEPEAKFTILKYCNDCLNKNMDNINKFMQTNQDARDYLDTKTKTLQNLLMSLSSDEIDNILNLLDAPNDSI